jgi:hypothetical protein
VKEADLYTPLKTSLENQGYEVKGEVEHCDVVALRGNEDPVIVELKLTLNMTVLLQATDRLSLSDTVYVGVPSTCRNLKTDRKRLNKLFKRVGLGLLSIDVKNKKTPVAVLVEPTDYRPRTNNKKKRRLLNEFRARVGDPNAGGTASRNGITTAYRQRAIKLAHHLKENGALKASLLAKELDDPKARDLMYANHYGWFDALGNGVYALNDIGINALIK